MFRNKLLPRIWFDGTPAAGEEAWNTYLNSLPEEQRPNVSKIVEDFHAEKNSKLLNTVNATREERDALASELREAASKAEKGSELKTKLTEQADKLDAANKRADFFEEAVVQKCNNPRLAWALAKQEDYFLKTGLPDWKTIKEKAPELFNVVKKPTGKAGAGAGTGNGNDNGMTINSWIRQQAGKGRVSTTEE